MHLPETVIAAIIGAAGAIGVRWFPKTSSEAALDVANTRNVNMQAWRGLVIELREEVQRLRRELKQAEERIRLLETQIALRTEAQQNQGQPPNYVK